MTQGAVDDSIHCSRDLYRVGLGLADEHSVGQPGTDAERRAAIVAESRAWLGTPYHHAQRVRGAGVDCAQFLIAVYSACGFIDAFDPGPYPSDWMLHRDVERFLGFVGTRARQLDICEQAQPGDVVLMRFGRVYSHGGILLPGRQLIHSLRPRGVVIDDLHEYSHRPMKFFSVLPA